MNNKPFYFTRAEKVGEYINRWDVFLLILIFLFLFFFAWIGQQMTRPYALGQPIVISLSPTALPFYALRTISRMFIALLFSLFFTLIFGTWAAKSRRAEQIVIPAIDILQSIPVLSFLSITVTGFIHLFPNSLLGPECASIFAIFTAQAWNMTFGFYQSLKTLPDNLKEVASVFQLSAWQRFWKVELPFSMSSLLWNMMISMSASWFFVVLSEAISVSHENIRLPGVGSYIAVAIQSHDLMAVLYALMMMTVIILLYDQILFRPLIAWSEKFRFEYSPEEEEYQSWLIDMIRRSHLLKRIGRKLTFLREAFVNINFKRVNVNLRRGKAQTFFMAEQGKKKQKIILDWLWIVIVAATLLFASFSLIHFILAELKLQDIVNVFLLGAITGSRVIILIVLSSLVWIPIGVWIGLRPRLAQKIQPLIQFAAAFPANLFYPLFVIVIVKFSLNVQIWLTPLMILGTQWYILFNVIAGASNIPRELSLAADNLGLRGWLWWKRLALPGIFPFYITGAICAAGGAWNASIVAEWVSWGSTTLRATGLGEYIQASTNAGDFPRIALGTMMMCLYVLAFNHLIWRPLYRLALDRYNFS